MQPRKSVNNRTQSGMSKWAMLMVVMALVVFGTAALKLGPHYIDFRVIQGVIDRLPEGEVHSEMTKADIREHFSKQFRIENFGLKVRDILTVNRTRGETVLVLEYEIREHLFYNIDVVLSFADTKTYR